MKSNLSKHHTHQNHDNASCFTDFVARWTSSPHLINSENVHNNYNYK